MFKKPLGNLKTYAPIRSSDRRKLKQKVVATYNLTNEDGDLLVPDGLQSAKYATHTEDPGILYTNSSGDPLWITVGKGSDDLIPTIYTLLKKQDLLPFLSTPAAVLPILFGGADLMIPGVVHCPTGLQEGQLVSIRRYSKIDGKHALSPPLAVGKLALPSDSLRGAAKTEKGKAVLVLHTWKDHLWELGSKLDIPNDSPITVQEESSAEQDGPALEATDVNVDKGDGLKTEEVTGTEESKPRASLSYSAEQVSDLLYQSLIQAIATSLSALPSSSFPITATVLYTTHILPSRPGFPSRVIPPAGGPTADDDREIPHVLTDITIKTSNHKSLTAFLKVAEKQGLLALKAPQKHSQQNDMLVMSVNKEHPAVIGHKRFVTVKDLEQSAAKKAAREEQATAKSTQFEIKELYKPHMHSVEALEAMGASKSDMYTLAEVKAMLNSYIASHQLVNPRDQAYINLDDVLYNCISTKVPGKLKSKQKDPEPTDGEPELSRFMKRDELTRNILERMQPWFEISTDGHDPQIKKGLLTPIQVVMKIRQGRKACTLITGFEPFLVIDADTMAEDLRKVCAGSTSVNPVPGKPAGSGLEVMVQGKQSQAVYDYLTNKGIPKKWIEVVELTGKK